MQDISILLDSEPTAELCQEMIECDILQTQAHKELVNYNTRKKFLGIHPLVINKFKGDKLLEKYKKLKRESPELFMKEVTNLNQNIRRIKSQIKQQRYKNEETLNRWKTNLEIKEKQYKIIESILN